MKAIGDRAPGGIIRHDHAEPQPWRPWISLPPDISPKPAGTTVYLGVTDNVTQLLKALRDLSDVRETLVAQVVIQYQAGVYGSRAMAEQTAQAILSALRSPQG